MIRERRHADALAVAQRIRRSIAHKLDAKSYTVTYNTKNINNLYYITK